MMKILNIFKCGTNHCYSSPEYNIASDLLFWLSGGNFRGFHLCFPLQQLHMPRTQCGNRINCQVCQSPEHIQGLQKAWVSPQAQNTHHKSNLGLDSVFTILFIPMYFPLQQQSRGNHWLIWTLKWTHILFLIFLEIYGCFFFFLKYSRKITKWPCVVWGKGWGNMITFGGGIAESFFWGGCKGH